MSELRLPCKRHTQSESEEDACKASLVLCLDPSLLHPYTYSQGDPAVAVPRDTRYVGAALVGIRHAQRCVRCIVEGRTPQRPFVRGCVERQCDAMHAQVSDDIENISRLAAWTRRGDGDTRHGERIAGTDLPCVFWRQRHSADCVCRRYRHRCRRVSAVRSDSVTGRCANQRAHRRQTNGVEALVYRVPGACDTAVVAR